MQFLPVIDVRGGIVVRAIAGRRSDYRPLVSRLTTSTDPLAVARAFREHFSWTDVYIAHLDAIAGAEPAFSIFKSLQADGFRLWVDAGIRNVADADRLAAAGVNHTIVGLETVRGPEVWRAIGQRLGTDRVVFSLDLRGGQPLTATAAWDTADASQIVKRVVADGGRRVIVLDLARVGVGSGTGTEGLCAELVRRHPGLAIYAGGGVRGPGDVQRLKSIGVAGVLLASALHDGAITSPVSDAS
jgi:phosphoribosylformimino-5-aminoimidazole carboxamide ribotide isomerase